MTKSILRFLIILWRISASLFGPVPFELDNSDPSLMITAALNPDGSIAIVILNMITGSKNLKLSLGDRLAEVQIGAQAIQTIVVMP